MILITNSFGLRWLLKETQGSTQVKSYNLYFANTSEFRKISVLSVWLLFILAGGPGFEARLAENRQLR